MRDYLYIWNNPDQKFILASGIEVSDLANAMAASGGLLLLDHQSDVAAHDANSGFGFVPCARVSQLTSEDIYSWGNIAWADYASEALPKIQPEQVAELLYFAHKTTPLKAASIAGLGNRFLAYAHDDGWLLKIHYNNWQDVSGLLKDVVPGAVLTALAAGDRGFWVRGGGVKEVEMTVNVDKVLNREL